MLIKNLSKSRLISPVHKSITTKIDTSNFRSQFVENGYIPNVPIFNEQEIEEFNHEISKIESLVGPWVAQELNPHLRFESLWNIATNDKLLNIVSSIYPDGYALFASAIFCKYPDPSQESKKYIGFHQDAYWNLEPNTMSTALSVFIAMDQVTVENGCVWFIPKSHKGLSKMRTIF